MVYSSRKSVLLSSPWTINKARPGKGQRSFTNTLSKTSTSDGIKPSTQGCTGYDPNSAFSKQFTWDTGVLPGMMFCDTTENVPYWLVNMHNPVDGNNPNSCDPYDQTDCTGQPPPKVSVPPGISTLDGKSWGGLTWQMLVESALASWKANGKKNGWASSDASTLAGMQDVSNNGINAKGVVNIPVCSWEDAKATVLNFEKGESSGKIPSRGPNYPCP
jgi:hypothetical protein